MASSASSDYDFEEDEDDLAIDQAAARPAHPRASPPRHPAAHKQPEAREPPPSDAPPKKQKSGAMTQQAAPATGPAPSSATLAKSATHSQLHPPTATAPPVSAPLPTTTEQAVLLYINEWNAPLNAQMLADHFRGAISKAQVVLLRTTQTMRVHILWHCRQRST